MDYTANKPFWAKNCNNVLKIILAVCETLTLNCNNFEKFPPPPPQKKIVSSKGIATVFGACIWTRANFVLNRFNIHPFSQLKVQVSNKDLTHK